MLSLCLRITHVRMTHSRRFLATWGGRVDIDKESGLAVYKRPPGAPLGWSKLSPGLSFKQTLFETGVTGSPQVVKGGRLMMITAISYFIIQVRLAWSREHDVWRVVRQWSSLTIDMSFQC